MVDDSSNFSDSVSSYVQWGCDYFLTRGPDEIMCMYLIYILYMCNHKGPR